MKATGIFKVTSWDEKPCDECWGGTKVTRASVTQTVSGSTEGEARVEYLTIYLNGGSATCNFSVVPGAGSGELAGLRGTGNYAAKHAEYPNVPFTLDYNFE